VKKFLLNLAPSEPLAFVQELPCLNNPIKLDPLLVSALDLCVHYLINGCMFHAVRVELGWCQLFCNLRGIQQWWKIWSEEVHIEHWVQDKEGGSVELKSIVTHNLGGSVRPIAKWMELPMGPCKALFPQM
jgi:hypothetical protein